MKSASKLMFSSCLAILAILLLVSSIKSVINWFRYCLDYFSIRHFTDILLFSLFLLYIILLFVKSILLNKYDDDDDDDEMLSEVSASVSF